MLTTKQRDLARHALGLPNRDRKSYRNHYCGSKDDPDWCAMVKSGAAVKSSSHRPYEDDAYFHLTPAGAQAALDPREKLCPEDFPSLITRPILFSAPMIIAILEGRKTQTRRVIGKTKYGIGNRIWVREAWSSDVRNDYQMPSEIRNDEPVWYLADGASINTTVVSLKSSKSRPSIFMPRWASRITLTVTDVRQQRLQEISEADAVAEGCGGFVSSDGEDALSPQEEFRDLWSRINGAGAWDANPLVTALTFTVSKQNIDEVAP